MKSLLAISIGASLGAWLRWGLATWFGPALITMGTLFANALGGLLMGCAMAWIQLMPQLSVEMRLLITTGFLGGLTTFSTFSAEAVTLLHKEAYTWFLIHIMSHVGLSILLTLLGYSLTMKYFAE